MKEPVSQANAIFLAISVTVLVFPGEIGFCKGQKPFKQLTQKFMASLPSQSPPHYRGRRMVNTQPSVNVS